DYKVTGVQTSALPISDLAEIVWGEIGEPETLRGALAGIDVVFHTAARVSGGGSRDAFRRDNIAAVEALLHAAEAAGVRRLVHVRSEERRVGKEGRSRG